MTKTMLLTLTLLACTAWVAAQSTSHSSPSSDSSGSQATAGSENGQMSGSANTGQMNEKGHTMIRGCLSSSGGGYTLTDASGAQYQLTGDTSQIMKWKSRETPPVRLRMAGHRVALLTILRPLLAPPAQPVPAKCST